MEFSNFVFALVDDDGASISDCCTPTKCCDAVLEVVTEHVVGICESSESSSGELL